MFGLDDITSFIGDATNNASDAINITADSPVGSASDVVDYGSNAGSAMNDASSFAGSLGTAGTAGKSLVSMIGSGLSGLAKSTLQKNAQGTSGRGPAYQHSWMTNMNLPVQSSTQSKAASTVDPLSVQNYWMNMMQKFANPGNTK